MTKPLAWTLKKPHIGSLSPDYKYLHARQIPHQMSFPSQTILDCIRNIIGVFAIILNRRRIFLLHEPQ